MRKVSSSSCKWNRTKILGTAILLVLFLCFPTVNIVAEETVTEAGVKPEVIVVSSRVGDQGTYLFLKNTDDNTTVSDAQIGNTKCDATQLADVTSMGQPIRTVIMLDNSISLGSSWGEDALELINQLLNNHAEGEVFRIATFSEDVTELSGYSDDYESLEEAVGRISFENQDTYLSEMLYSYLKDADDEKPNYTRFIIIADGADDNDISYTQAELAELMKNAGVVIHTVGLKGKGNEELLETLFSYSRLTGGTYSVTEVGDNVEDICNKINEDYGLKYIELLPDSSIMDGSRKEIKLSLQTGTGEATIKTSSRMPFGNAGAVSSEALDTEEDEEPAPALQNPLPVIQTKPAEEKKPGVPVWTWIAVGLAGTAAIVFAVFLIRKKRKAPETSKTTDAEVAAPKSVGTRLLSAEELDGKYVVLTDVDNPRRNFRARIVTSIVIGRETGEIMIDDDDAVSGKQCEIVKKGKLYYLNDLDSSNGTYYEGNRIYSEIPIMDGGLIGIGAHKYKVRIG